MNETKSFSLNKSDLKKIVKGLALAMGGAGTVYILGIFETIQVEANTAIYVALASAVLNALKVWIQGQEK